MVLTPAVEVKISMEAKRGDRIVVGSQQVGTPSREGEILEVIEGAVRVAYRVRWADGHESVFTPSVGSASILPSPSKAKGAGRARRTSPTG
jgi:hypothetical protein